MQIIKTDKAPEALGPYSQAVVHDGLVFCSGQIALGVDGVEAQTKQVLVNLEAVLVAAGSARADVLKTTIYLANMNDFETVNEVYAEFFGDHKPARATVEVSRLPKDVKVEIECIARLT
ncbi:deaminase [Candidatus Peregrinibacteria bacterium]|jgi:2-iminobutanoate/2-iminopropanoate deaminase|nr:deaminase [Candidatus Peregrinibacteria bacterium]MBT7484410.1 deaminase [Candidatus Peregrinibacteria bacterium]MBT7703174.1 deaminase [Candidatus Peregrinibacteria bacterium]